MKLPRWIAFGLLLAAFPLAVAGWAGDLRLSGNIHQVEPGLLYRSAQLDGDKLRSTLRRYRIRTLINLRGAAPGRGWYDDEVSISAEMGVKHVDIALSADREPDKSTLRRLISALENDPTPIMIHCSAGADRSGLAAALYEYVVAHKSADQADRQLSFWYGHFPWLTSPTVAMDRAYWHFVKNDPQKPKTIAQ